MEVTTFPYQNQQKKKKKEDYVLQKIARASDLKTSIASKILLILHQNLGQWRDLAPSTFEDFNLKSCKYM